MTGFRLECGREQREVRLEKGAAFLDGRRICFREVRAGGELEAVETDGGRLTVRSARQADRVFVWRPGADYEIRLAGARRRAAAGEPAADLLAPMPGRVRRTLVRRGEKVVKGQVVLVLEAMKMEHSIRAPQDGVVTRVEHGEGDLVEAGTVLAEIGDPAPSPPGRGMG